MSQAEIDRGEKARKLLADETLIEAFNAVRAAIFDKIEGTPLRDAEGLMQLRIMLKLLNDVRANLQTAIRDGKVAMLSVEQEKRRFRDYLR